MKKLSKIAMPFFALCLLSLTPVKGQIPEFSTTGPQTLKFTTRVQDFIIPDDINFQYLFIYAEGGDGGKRQVKEAWGTTRFTVAGGSGASIKGTFEIGSGTNQIPPGSTIRSIVGERGNTRTGQTSAGCEGGGGTGVLFQKPNSNKWHLLMVAGGGGGAYSDCCTVKSAGKPAEIGTSGSDGKKNGYKGGADGFVGDWVRSNGGGIYGYRDEDDHEAVFGWEGGNADPSTEPTMGKNIASGALSDDQQGAQGFSYGGAADYGFHTVLGGIPGGGGGYSGGGAGEYNAGAGGGGSYLNTDMSIDEVLIANGTTTDTKDGFVTIEFRNSILSQEISLVSSSNKCMAVNSQSTGEEAKIATCSSSDDWIFDGEHVLNTYNGQSNCIEAKDGKDANGTTVQLQKCNDFHRQDWIFDGRLKAFRFWNNIDKCISVNASNKLELQSCENENTKQVWNLDQATTADLNQEIGSIKLTGTKNYCVNNSNGNTSPGNKIGIFNCKGNDNQLWYFDGAKIRLNAARDMCVILEKDDTSNGNSVYLHICTDKNSNKWAYDGITKQFRLASNLDKCISSNGFGEALTIQDCDSSDELQLFELQ